MRAALCLAPARWLDRHAAAIVGTLARLVFAGVLLQYFWASALTKTGDGLAGLYTPAFGAYAQIFPRLLEASGYDFSVLGSWHRAVVVFATLAEFVLPALIVVGLATRIAALGMIGFVLVQSATDIFGHGATIGAWFDRFPDALILDQRALWIVLLTALVALGAGPLSLDRLLRRSGQPQSLDGRAPAQRRTAI